MGAIYRTYKASGFTARLCGVKLLRGPKDHKSLGLKFQFNNVHAGNGCSLCLYFQMNETDFASHLHDGKD